MIEEKKILHLTLKGKWFDLIASGEKKEDYRDLKDYWGVRLCYKVHVPPWPGGGYLSKWTKLREGDRECLKDDFIPNFEKFDAVHFRNGYSQNSPIMEIEYSGTNIGIGNSEWGASGSEQFIIKLGKILSIKNYNK